MAELNGHRWPWKNEFDSDFLVEAIEEGYKELSKRKSKSKVSFAPSTIGYQSGTCPRRWYYAFTTKDLNVVTPVSGIATMMAGTGSHERLQSALTASGIKIDIEEEVTHEDPPIRGFVDAIVEIDGERVPVEIKTTIQEAFVFREATGKVPAYNLIQLLIYMYILKSTKGILIYESKNTNRLVNVSVVLTEERRKFVEYMLQWLREVKQAIDEEQFPERPKRWTKTGVKCKQCPFNEICWSDNSPTDIYIAPLKADIE